jgi:hypothetical protein
MKLTSLTQKTAKMFLLLLFAELEKKWVHSCRFPVHAPKFPHFSRYTHNNFLQPVSRKLYTDSSMIEEAGYPVFSDAARKGGTLSGYISLLY